MRLVYILFFSVLSFSSEAQECLADTLFQPIGENPHGLATDGDFFWVTERQGGTASVQLNKYDLDGNYLETILEESGLDNYKSCLEIIADTLWLVKEQQGKLLKLDKNTGALYAEYELPTFNESDPNHSGLTFDGNYLWVSEHESLLGGSNLYKVDPNTGATLSSLKIEIDWVFSVEWINGRLYAISHFDQTLYKVDTETGEVTFIQDWCVESPMEFTYVEAEQLMYGVNHGNDLQQPGYVLSITGLDVPTFTQEISREALYLRLMPNPVQDHLFVQTELDLGRYWIQNGQGITHIQGEFRNEPYAVNVATLSPGIYYLIVESKGKRNAQSFIKW